MMVVPIFEPGPVAALFDRNKRGMKGETGPSATPKAAGRFAPHIGRRADYGRIPEADTRVIWRGEAVGVEYARPLRPTA
jgi:hypothetical protein